MSNRTPDTFTPADDFDRMPPHSTDAERCLLAAMSVDRDALRAVLSEATADWFFLTDHALIFSHLEALARDGDSAVTPIALAAALERSGKLAEVGGKKYIVELFDHTLPGVEGWERYLDTVRERFQFRRAKTIATKLAAEAQAMSRPAAELMAEATEALAGAVADTARTEVLTLDDILDQVQGEIRHPENRPGLVSYGFPTLDEALGGGVGAGELVLFGARPSMGKSTIMRQIGLLSAMRRDPVLYVSLEESPRKVGRNLLSWQSNVVNNRLRGQLQPTEMQRVDEAAAKLRGLPFHFVWGQSSAAKVQALVSSYIARHGVKLVMLDYLQLMNAGGKTPYERASEASRAIVRIARGLNVATVCAVQLNRAVTGRDDKRPTMADIRDSGQIEQDADVILLLHREDYYHLGEDGYAKTGKADLIRAKVRDGERGSDPIQLDSQLQFQAFIDPRWGEPEQSQLFQPAEIP